MKKEEFDSKMSGMLEKLDADNSNLILDDVAVFINDNISMNELIEKKEKEISELKSRNETLQRVNGNLLQQVGTQIPEADNSKNENVDKYKPVFNMRDVFDAQGNFKLNYKE